MKSEYLKPQIDVMEISNDSLLASSFGSSGEVDGPAGVKSRRVIDRFADDEQAGW
mgnify:CR=1 FL=1